MTDISQKLWNYCHVLLADGMHFSDYVEQLTYLLFLKMANERTQARKLCKGSTRDFLSQDILKNIVFPVPSLDEQLKICGEVEQELSVIAELEAQLPADIARAGRLRQSILSSAFAGERALGPDAI